MNDIEHPAIREIESTGYPSREYLEYERECESDYRESTEREETK